MPDFDDAVVTAVLSHMNTDHPDDNLVIARAFGRASATAAVMTGLDQDAGVWRVTEGHAASDLRVDWPAGPITERAEIRREVVALYDAACARMGRAPRPH